MVIGSFTTGEGNGSFRPRVVSALSRFGPEAFRPWVVSAWVVSAWVVSAWVVSAQGRFGLVGGSFRPIFPQLLGLLPKVNLIHFWLVGECMGRGKALGLCTGWFTQTKAPVPTN